MARKKTTSSRSRGVALLVTGMLIGTVMVSPAGAHVTGSLSHLLGHLKGTFYTKAQIDQRAIGCRGNGSGDAMVKVGSVCIDRYENSIWTRKTGGTRITGAIPCLANGQDCKGKIFARSVAGVSPRTSISWFQAQQALANSGKRLPTNAEWQMAVAGTPDHPGHCNTAWSGPGPTGSAGGSAKSGCVSSRGAYDMVGNVWEWVADWVPRSSACGAWPAGYGGDSQCLAGAATTGAPGALVRGGDWGNGTQAGPFAVSSSTAPSDSVINIGFRGAR